MARDFLSSIYEDGNQRQDFLGASSMQPQSQGMAGQLNPTLNSLQVPMAGESQVPVEQAPPLSSFMTDSETQIFAPETVGGQVGGGLQGTMDRLQAIGGEAVPEGPQVMGAQAPQNGLQAIANRPESGQGLGASVAPQGQPRASQGALPEPNDIMQFATQAPELTLGQIMSPQEKRMAAERIQQGRMNALREISRGKSPHAAGTIGWKRDQAERQAASQRLSMLNQYADAIVNDIPLREFAAQLQGIQAVSPERVAAFGAVGQQATAAGNVASSRLTAQGRIEEARIKGESEREVARIGADVVTKQAEAAITAETRTRVREMDTTFNQLVAAVPQVATKQTLNKLRSKFDSWAAGAGGDTTPEERVAQLKAMIGELALPDVFPEDIDTALTNNEDDPQKALNSVMGKKAISAVRNEVARRLAANPQDELAMNVARNVAGAEFIKQSIRSASEVAPSDLPEMPPNAEKPSAFGALFGTRLSQLFSGKSDNVDKIVALKPNTARKFLYAAVDDQIRTPVVKLKSLADGGNPTASNDYKRVVGKWNKINNLVKNADDSSFDERDRAIDLYSDIVADWSEIGAILAKY